MSNALNVGKKVAFSLIVIWFIMFFTNILGAIGSRSILAQDIVWIAIPIVGIVFGMIAIIKKVPTKLDYVNIALSLIILFLWLAISSISKM